MRARGRARAAGGTVRRGGVFGLAGLVGLAGLALACGGAPLPSDTGLSGGKPPATAGGQDARGLPATLLARLESEEVWPLYAPREAGGLVVLASSGRFRAIAVPKAGSAPPTPRDLAAAPRDLRLAVLRATASGYALVWVEPAGTAFRVVMLGLDPKGAPQGVPTPIVESARAPLSLDLVATGAGALVVWDAEGGEEGAESAGSEVFVASAIPGAPASIVKLGKPALSGVLAWDVAPSASGHGAALAAVVAPAAGGADAAPGRGRVVLAAIDPAGVVAAPVPLTAEPRARPDVSIAAFERGFVAAWTDEGGPEPTVHLAAVGPDGRPLRPAAPALPPGGEQFFVALAAPPGGRGKGLLAWEEPLRSPAGLRAVRLAPLGGEGLLSPDRALLVMSAEGRPDLEAFEGGFSALTLAPASSLGVETTEGAIWPAFVRFGPSLDVVASAPVRAAVFGAGAGSPGIPLFVRGLACPSGRCTALASGAGERPPLALLDLPALTGGKQAPAERIRPDARPHAASIAPLWRGEHVAEVAASAPSSGPGFAAWVTYVPPGEAAGEAARSPEATLAVAPLPASLGAGQAAPAIISKRALSTGGVAIASTPGGDTVLAWVAKERGEPQVFVTKIGAAGEKVSQKLLTTLERKGKGAASREPRDVAIAPAPALPGLEEGFVVAWVDPRHGPGGEVYAARIDRALRKTVSDRRITQAEGAASEVALAVRGGEVHLAWADARGDVEGGSADVFAATLDARTLVKKGEETRLLESAVHSRSPALALGAKSAVVAWIEEADEAAGPGALSSVYVAELGGGPPARLDLGGSASSVSLACAPGAAVCRGVAVRVAPAGALDLFAFAPVPQRPAPLRPLATLAGPPGSDIAPAFAGDRLVFADNTAEGARIRAMSLAW